MLLKILAAVVVFVLVIAGFNYGDPGHQVNAVIRVLVAFVGAYIAFTYAPSNTRRLP